MTHIESQHASYLWMHGDGKIGRLLTDLTFIRWPNAWADLPMSERCERIEDFESPALLFCLTHNQHIFDQSKRRDYLCVSLAETDRGDMCALECFAAGMRIYRKAKAQVGVDRSEVEAMPAPEIPCPALPERIDRWFASIELEAA